MSKTDERRIGASLLGAVAIQTIGAVDKQHKMPGPRSYAPVFLLWIAFGIAAALDESAAKIASALSVLVLLALAMGTAGAKALAWLGSTVPTLQGRGLAAGSLNPLTYLPSFFGGTADVSAPAGTLVTVGSVQVDASIRANVEAILRDFRVSTMSGYRSGAHNAAVGGAPDSDHLCGLAVDFAGAADEMMRLARWAQGQGFAFMAYTPLTGYPNHNDHVHISFRRCP